MNLKKICKIHHCGSLLKVDKITEICVDFVCKGRSNSDVVTIIKKTEKKRVFSLVNLTSLTILFTFTFSESYVKAFHSK